MDDLERIRQEKLRELQERQKALEQEQAQADAAGEAAAQQEAAIERVLMQVLDSEARERLTRIRLARPDFARQVTHQLVALAQAGRLTRRLSDADLRALLQKLQPDDRDINITRK